MTSFFAQSASGPSELADRPVSETVERFLKAVISQVPLERIEELHLFAPLRQGSVETGIAVVAADVPVPEIIDTPSSPVVELALDHGVEDEELVEEPVEELVTDVVEPVIPAQRHTVYTARYRYTIKGPERGKWESSIRAEADAPLVTVETVVRGVQRRAGEDTAIIRYNAAQIAKALRVDVAKPEL